MQLFLLVVPLALYLAPKSSLSCFCPCPHLHRGLWINSLSQASSLPPLSQKTVQNTACPAPCPARCPIVAGAIPLLLSAFLPLPSCCPSSETRKHLLSRSLLAPGAKCAQKASGGRSWEQMHFKEPRLGHTACSALLPKPLPLQNSTENKRSTERPALPALVLHRCTARALCP